ncbi:hypothetical protein LLT36_002356 [Salmonella enterica subsp. enterica serovar Uganda]|uniref:hypothetical protein n=1 Tax=unclassified Erwinia TaxID=2622719 RepID=UPI000C196D0C|nr:MULTISPECIES: hypothetical protein [unclassified Erwinia]EIL2948576.1 hypothetical protein [Salmonella enterica subsp. enterica serovar Uganda]EIX2952274.1 hypothetical protein [Salmonella enterica subsp. enterica serovar Uganda]PIJ48954.1 hypothetical protein BV501_14670 [Erwinia sp. OAMSP11]PIJ74608.1 hypothetical protein BK416_03875 [Erwinia sp. OLSSP12]PIJ79639.1 hypothetical protein BLD47_13295 [Erwinia sp. OLCASP19]
MADINFDPFKTQGSFAGSFNVESRGLTQGDAQDDPAIRLQLCSGTLDKNLDAPVWGGIGVVECVSTVAENVSGSTIKKATASVCNAFTVFNQAYHGITTASNPVPLYLAGGSVHYYRVGSGARIPLPISAAVAALATGDDPVGADGFVWDMTENCVDVYSSGSSSNPKVNISLLMVSQQGNLTVKKETSGNVVWENGKPCGLFLI